MPATTQDWDERYYHVDQILEKPGPRTDPGFLAGDEVKEFLRKKCKILVIGAGGLGCEILANLALTGFKDIHVIDMDTIDIMSDTTYRYYGKIQDKDDDYYMQFNLVICGLDSVEARRWINATLVNMVDPENPESLKPLIDGGTEGHFGSMSPSRPMLITMTTHRVKGQARVILPTVSSCYECSLDMLNKPTAFPICTIANTPRLPEHCIEWASVLEWPRVHGGKSYSVLAQRSAPYV
ncbi:NEDD8 activating enzyme [Salix suchowensis]|nr:NEDD8 activating enzyme [Salix suchowensis]